MEQCNADADLNIAAITRRPLIGTLLPSGNAKIELPTNNLQIYKYQIAKK